MADNDTTRGPKPGESGNILKQARERWDRSLDKERENIRLAYEDLNFLAGDQWPPQQRKDRENDGRPCLQINHIPQFIHQITGDIRQMKPSLKFVPVDSGSDEKVADLFGGLSRYIENRSDASAVYFAAADMQVACGVAHWRVLTEYADDTTFNQEIRIAPVEDGVSVLWDPDSTLPNRADANFCFVPVDMTKAAFEEAYHDVKAADFDDEKWGQNHEWVTEDTVRVVEYWVKKPTKRLLALGRNGTIVDLTDEDDPKYAAAVAKQQGARIEQRDSHKVCRYLITASDVLEETDWPGRIIPIVRVIGKETRIGRKTIRSGVVRNAIEPQRMLNYFHSAHTETVALQPKAPFMVTEHNVAKYQSLWEEANAKNQPYLVYEPDSKNGGASPQRIQPPVSSSGVLDGLTLAVEHLKAVTGIYDPALGKQSNETSGRAIIARQREGDVGSYLYIDNFSRAIRRTGEILADLIPRIYDTERTIRIMGDDGKIDLIEINKAEGLGETGKIVNDITAGTYDVVTTVGPSYSTKREEAKEGMIALLQAVPEVGPLIMDLVAKAQDWPMADDIAKRMRASLPPAILAMEEAEKQGMDPEQARQQMMEQNKPPPDPKVMEVQAKIENDGQRLQFDQAKAANDAQVEMQKLAVEQQTKQADMQHEMHKLEQEAMLKREELAMTAALERERMDLDARVRIQIAEINAAAKEHDSYVRADTARYATDNKPDPRPAQ